MALENDGAPPEVLPILVGVASASELAHLDLAGLSDWFDPFLRYFAAETLRCGGEVTMARDGDRVVALSVFAPGEQVASIFTRSRALAEALARRRENASVFADFPLGTSEPYVVVARDPRGGANLPELRHVVRRATSPDVPVIQDLLREVHGRVDERWFVDPPAATERLWVAELDGTLAGVAGVTLVDGHARLHSLSVRPVARGLGIGTDLLAARLWWLRGAGARSVVSEIAERNVPSRAAAARVGLAPVGRMYRTDRARRPRPGVPATA